MSVKLLEVKRESCPAARLIGKRYRGEPNWGEWWANNWFEQLEATPRLPFNGDASIGAKRIVDGMPEHWVGMLFPPDTEVMDGFEYADIEPLEYAICYLYGKEGSQDFYGYDTHDMCLTELKKRNLKRNEVNWCMERYNCPRFTTPDEAGNVILDYGISIL